MKKYYLHNGTESSGPFAIEELKAKNITKESPVWFEGMLHWKTAGEIPELTSLFIVTPPPLAPFLFPPVVPKEKVKRAPRIIMGLSRNNFFMACGALIVLIGIGVSNTIQDNRSRALQLQNHKTEVENYQLELKQKQADDEKIQAVIQQRIEEERVANEKKQINNSRLLEIGRIMADSQMQLEIAKKNLADASEFELLRSESEKREQLDALQRIIDSIKNRISQLQNESDQLKLELEKFPK